LPLSEFIRVERRFKELQDQHNHGELSEDAFRVEVAKLLLRDEQGTFWMLDAGDRTWFCNRGEGWMPGDPHAERPFEIAPSQVRRRQPGPVLILSVLLLALLILAAILVLRPRLASDGDPDQPTSPASTIVQVAIASPNDGSQATLDHEVAIESTISATPDLQAVERVELQVNGQTVETQPVRSKIQPGQTSLPLSLPWLPPGVGEYQVTVVALSSQDTSLGKVTITLYVTEASSEVLPEPACIPDATFVADVTIPPGSAFPPGARMDKVWQVRNSGSCAWGVGYELILVDGERLDSSGTVLVPPTAAGSPADLTVTFSAPDEAGTYSSTWRLRSPDGEFFGPMLSFHIEVEALAEESSPPHAPANLQATITQDGKAIQLTWEDRSDNEDAFRVYREDVEASIGLAPANVELFVDEAVTCGNTYRYGVVAFNAAGALPISEMAEATLPLCAPTDTPPTLVLTVVPTQVLASETFTIVFQANDDVGVTQVIVWGEKTGYPELDMGRVFTCTGMVCAASWPMTGTEAISNTLVLVAIASDSSGQESDPARVTVDIPRPE
jgi:hypothetical protein